MPILEGFMELLPPFFQCGKGLGLVHIEHEQRSICTANEGRR